MSVPGPRLVAMANDIAAYFDTFPDRDAAVSGMVTHLERFWEPGMRRAIVNLMATGSDTGLSPLAQAAVTALAARLEPDASPR